MNTVPKTSPVLDYLGELHRKYAWLRDGKTQTLRALFAKK